MKTLSEKIAVMQAAEREEHIEFYSTELGCWLPAPDPFWDWSEFDYRVAEKPTAPVVVAPEGFELVDANSDEYAKQDWKCWMPNTGWVDMFPYTSNTCAFWYKSHGARYAKPITSTNPPPVPDGYELMPADSAKVPKLGWKVWDKEEFPVWSPMRNDHNESCRHLNQYAGARYCRPIVKRTPKMPDAPVWWFRTSAAASHNLTTVIADSEVFRIEGGIRYSVQSCAMSKYQWSPDRKTWYNFYGDKVS
jgi:hypothetical protein